MQSNTVVIVGQTPPPVHGSTLVCQELVQMLNGAGTQTRVIEKGFSNTVTDVGKPSTKKLFRVPQLAAEIVRITRRDRAPIIYFISLNPAAFLVDAFNIAAIRRNAASPLALYIHGTGFRELADRGSWWRRAVASTLAAANVCVTLTPSLEDDISVWVPPHRRTVIRNPVPGNDPGPQATPSALRYLFLSNLVREKGADVFLEAASTIAATYPEAYFAVAGAAYDLTFEKELALIAGRPHLRGRVHLHGPADHEDKTALFASSSVLVFPSRYRFEAAPLTILEAKRAGRGVIASRQGGIADMITNGIDGQLVEDCTYQNLAKAMSALAKDPDLASRWGAAARLDYQRNYSSECFRASWTALLRRLSGAR